MRKVLCWGNRRELETRLKKGQSLERVQDLEEDLRKLRSLYRETAASLRDLGLRQVTAPVGRWSPVSASCQVIVQWALTLGTCSSRVAWLGLSRETGG